MQRQGGTGSFGTGAATPSSRSDPVPGSVRRSGRLGVEALHSVTSGADHHQMVDETADDARRSARRARRLAKFYYLHPPFLIAALFLGYETFTKISLLYTTIVSALTAGATYAAKGKATEAEAVTMDVTMDAR